MCKLVQQYKPQFVLKEGNLYKKQNRIEIHSFKFKKPLCVWDPYYNRTAVGSNALFCNIHIHCLDSFFYYNALWSATVLKDHSSWSFTYNITYIVYYILTYMLIELIFIGKNISRKKTRKTFTNKRIVLRVFAVS